MQQHQAATSSMRIAHAKLDYFNGNLKKKFSYDDLMGKIIDYIEQHPDFKKEVFA
jgi:hypothetical protein